MRCNFNILNMYTYWKLLQILDNNVANIAKFDRAYRRMDIDSIKSLRYNVNAIMKISWETNINKHEMKFNEKCIIYLNYKLVPIHFDIAKSDIIVNNFLFFYTKK